MESRSTGQCCILVLLIWLMGSSPRGGSRACSDHSDISEQCASTRSNKQGFITYNANTPNKFEK
eukprot:6362225-Pyramimonas_sp.AAC.1